MQRNKSSSQIIWRRRKRRQDAKQNWQNKQSKFAQLFALIFSTILALSILWAVYNYSIISKNLPSIEILPVLLNPEDGQLLEPTRIYDRSEEIVIFSLENPNSNDAEYLQYSEIPKYVIDATIAVLDPAFWDHDGFSYSLENNKTTIAERLAKNILLWNEFPSFEQIIRQKLLAAQINHQYGKEKIIEWTLNSANYGHLAYGVDQAAHVYFGKSAKDLTLSESAILAATLETPTLNPIDTPGVVIEKQEKVLQLMLAQELIDFTEAKQANNKSIQIQNEASPVSSFAPDYLNLVLDQLYAEFGISRVQMGGLKVISSLDIRLQNETSCTIETQLGRLNGSMHLDEIQENCETARLLPRIGRDLVSPISSQEGSVVILDPSSGQVLALVGEAEKAHPPGTILTPFIYLTAFTLEMSPASLFWDIPNMIPEDILESYPLNYEYNGPVSLRTALANDYISPAMETLKLVGPSIAWKTAILSGIKSLKIPSSFDSYSMILDQGSLNLLELSHAYSMLSNQGILAGQLPNNHQNDSPEIITIIRIDDYSGNVLFDNSDVKNLRVVSDQLAYLVTDILSDESARQSSLGHPNSLETGRPTAAKIGLTSDQSNAWTVGYTPQMVVGVWLGKSESNSADTTPVSPSATAGLWNAIIKTTYSNLPLSSWNIPSGLNRVTVCDPSGLLPTNKCPNLVTELFISGIEPVHQDNLYQSILINTQTNRLATVYSPAEFVKEQIYLVVPPNASEWAKSSGLNIPPNTYDVIFNNPNQNSPVTINSPEIFSYVSGELSIQGSAKGEDFSYYRIQIGEGLNPRQWLQIGENHENQVDQGELAIWDTKGLNGLYVIQLLLVNQDQTVETSIVQVSVDNQAPDIQLIVPENNQVFQYPTENKITIQAQIEDNLGVKSVHIYVDDKLISMLSNPPYIVPWSGLYGEHELKIVATDLAGNSEEIISIFQFGN